MRVDTDSQKIYGFKLRLSDRDSQETIEEVKCEGTELLGVWQQRDVPASMQIVGVVTSAEQAYWLKRVGFVVSRTIPDKGKAYIKTIADRDQIDIMDANKTTTVYIGPSIRDETHFEEVTTSP